MMLASVLMYIKDETKYCVFFVLLSRYLLLQCLRSQFLRVRRQVQGDPWDVYRQVRVSIFSTSNRTLTDFMGKRLTKVRQCLRLPVLVQLHLSWTQRPWSRHQRRSRRLLCQTGRLWFEVRA
jgi:hypothetical protein